jgi:hypothetical protein
MGAIEGALIGGFVGGAVAGYVAWNLARWQKAFVAAVDAGDVATARKILAKRATGVPPSKSFPLNKLLQQRARVVGLWLLGDLDAVRAELAMHHGSAAYLANVQMWGQICLALEADDPSGDLAMLDATATRVEAESNRLQKLLRDLAQLLYRGACGLRGTPIADSDARRLMSRAHQDPLLSRILILRLLAISAERAGKPNPRLVASLAGITRRFERDDAKAAL